LKLGLRVGELRNIKLEDLALSQAGLDIEAELDALRDVGFRLSDDLRDDTIVAASDESWEPKPLVEITTRRVYNTSDTRIL